MLFYKFRNFEEFNELFGIQHHGNGEKSRKNKILLSYIKDRKLLHDAITSGDFHLLHISSMAELKQTMIAEILRSGIRDDNLPYKVEILKNIYRSANYYTDDYKGVCEDGDYRAIRYVNAENGRVFKMKIGKLYRKLILETAFGRTLPEQVITYLCEEIAQEWQTFTMGCLPQNRLHVNSDFQRIYDSDECVGDFHSCMVDKGFHTFYENAVNASAAYLENEDGKIIARCIIYNEVRDQHDKVWRLAERQYSTECNDILKRALVDALIRDGHIDGYKKSVQAVAIHRLLWTMKAIRSVILNSPLPAIWTMEIRSRIRIASKTMMNTKELPPTSVRATLNWIPRMGKSRMMRGNMTITMTVVATR